MFERLIAFSIARRWLVLLAVLGMAGLGLASLRALPIDAVPDITNVQVQINTAAPGYSPLETEQRITNPIEAAMAGLPRLEQTRSLSRYGLSAVTVVFKDGTDMFFARQMVSEKMAQARASLPSGVNPEMGPIATGLSEIYYWTVEARDGAMKPDGTPYTPADLREIQDWIIKPQLRTVPGVTDINTIGGDERQYQVAPAPDKLAAYGLGMHDLVAAIERNNASVGAGYIEQRGEQFLVRASGQVQSLAQLGAIVVASRDGVPVQLRDVATLQFGAALRTGAATENGREVVLGTVFMLMGQNSRTVSDAVHKKLRAINRSLPAGVYAAAVYNRTTLVDKAIATVARNLVEGAMLVVLVLFLFLGNVRAALITALVIPLSMLFTFSGMVAQGVSANLMSLGALDFGIIVDGAVVIVEGCVRRLAHAQQVQGRRLTLPERLVEVAAAAREARRPLLFGQLIIMVVYLPIFALAGVEGRMFHPMAWTVVMALLGAMILSVTFVPAAVALFIGDHVQEREPRVMAAAGRWYGSAFDAAMRAGPVVLAAAGTVLVLSALLLTRLGSEFMPSLNEGDLAVLVMRAPGTSVAQSVRMQQQLERTLKARFPEIDRMFARIGTADVATDPMPPNAADSFIMLHPESAWPTPRKTRAQLREAIEAVASEQPGTSYEFSQPIQLRFNELISGVRSDVAVKLFGDDLAVLGATAAKMAEVLETVPGASEVKVEQTEGLPMLTLRVAPEAAARYGLSVADVQQVLSGAVGGADAGAVFEGDRRFDIVVRLPEALRNDVAALRRLPVPLPASDQGAASVPLSEVATLTFAPEPAQLSRENGKRRVVVTANVRGVDVGTFVAAAQAKLGRAVPVPPGYWVAWGGQFENLASAVQRLQMVVPLALLLVFVLLYGMFGSIKDGALVFTGVPFALTGGVVALWLRDMPLSIPAAVGFIALSGVAVLNGLVMVAFIRALRDGGMAIDGAIRTGALARLRPVLMTALVASLGFVPMALSTGTGAEVQRPLATVVIGGVLSSTLLTLLVLPLLYRLVHRKEDKVYV
ncbi:MAG TPA: CusA/CzcA family heavy metal efflux RND transporter [Telluria sp.]